MTTNGARDIKHIGGDCGVKALWAAEEKQRQQMTEIRKLLVGLNLNADLPSFNGKLRIEDFLDLITEVERLFEMMEIPKEKMNCSQGTKSVFDYKAEFSMLSEQNNLSETKGQCASRYLNGLNLLLRDKIGLQVLWTVDEAHNITLKAELQERRGENSEFQINTPDSLFPNRDKGVQSSGPSSQPKEVSGEEGSSSSQTITPTNKNIPRNPNPNPYAKPTPGICYRCRKLGHFSNACPNRCVVVNWEEEGEESPNALEDEEREGDLYEGA
ncbi:hypothetical protein Ddye_012759 [Dipteronia dyeriana]|uniref:CCHC-type domain-containing protein n=1 Tax=Dipteronia dyeriana TaxID=168575 RepID=A0AAE0CJJ6_9ROSI|nr:hypothetical protein Ddye_012759 [Dipteronia dyeriana]